NGVKVFVEGTDVGDAADDRGRALDAAAGPVLDGGVGPALHELVRECVRANTGLGRVAAECRPVGGGEEDGGDQRGQYAGKHNNVSERGSLTDIRRTKCVCPTPRRRGSRSGGERT